MQLSDPLPTVPVPLREPDGEVAMDLAIALQSIYDEAAYDLSLDYNASPPPPKLSEAETTWMRQELA